MKKYIAMCMATMFALFVVTAKAAPPTVEKTTKNKYVVCNSKILPATDIGQRTEEMIVQSDATWKDDALMISTTVVQKIAEKAHPPVVEQPKKEEAAYICYKEESQTADTSPGAIDAKNTQLNIPIVAVTATATDTSPGEKKAQEENIAGAAQINAMATDIGQRVQANQQG
jgi:hypothetical protein